MTSTCSSSDDEATVRRDAEERAMQELEAQRRASRQRVLNVWDSLERRYSRPLDGDDIVDLDSLTLLQDIGTLREMKDAPYGSLSLATSDNEDDEDELAVWDDDHSAEATLYRGKSQLSEDDLRDLQEFLRAERLRREVQGDLDESENEEVSEEETRERGDDGIEEATSVSSFRPSASEERVIDSEDELSMQRTPQKHVQFHSEYEESAQEETDASESEDELAASDDGYVEYARPLKPDTPVQKKPVEKVLQADRTRGNPQLSTPPLSKSSVLSSTPDITHPRTLWKPRASSVLPSKSHVEGHSQFTRGDAIRPVLRRPSVPPPRPQSLLGKRKPSPLTYRYVEEPPNLSANAPHSKTFSNRKEETGRRTKSQDEGVGQRRPQHRVAGADHLPNRHISRSPEKRVKNEPSDPLQGIITPADLSHLVYHLREVNEWVKSHQIADLEFDGASSQVSSSHPTPSRPLRTVLPSFMTPPHTAFRGEALHSGSLSRSVSSATGPPPTPAHLFDSSPIKHTLQSKPSGSRLASAKRPNSTPESPRKRTQQFRAKHVEDPHDFDEVPRPQLSRSLPLREKRDEPLDRISVLSAHRNSENVRLDHDDLFSPQVVLERPKHSASRSVRPRLY